MADGAPCTTTHPWGASGAPSWGRSPCSTNGPMRGQDNSACLFFSRWDYTQALPCCPSVVWGNSTPCSPREPSPSSCWHQGRPGPQGPCWDLRPPPLSVWGPGIQFRPPWVKGGMCTLGNQHSGAGCLAACAGCLCPVGEPKREACPGRSHHSPQGQTRPGGHGHGSTGLCVPSSAASDCHVKGKTQPSCRLLLTELASSSPGFWACVWPPTLPSGRAP